MANDPAMGEPKKRMTRFSYKAGPMGFLSDQIIKEMQRAGYPAKSHCLHRSEQVQQREFDEGDSKARPWQSAHQYFCASDLIHERWAWFAHQDAPDGTQFWNTLWDCVELVSERFDVKFSPRLAWDAAHVQLADWRQFKEQVGKREPNQTELDRWFQQVLPRVWQQHVDGQARRKGATN